MIIIATVAALGAAGVMTTMITTATTADAAKECHRSGSANGALIVACPPGTQGKCPEGSPGCGMVCTSEPDTSCRFITPGQ
jgi:hypothetical protein